jgi:hypothetical protein
MAASFTTCTKEKQQVVNRFMWAEGARSTQIHRKLSAQYGNSVLPVNVVGFPNHSSSVTLVG